MTPRPAPKKKRPTKFQLHMRKIGAAGGKKTLKKYGKNHFRNLSLKRWEDRN